MSKKSKGDVAVVAEIEADRAVERAIRAVVMRREGSSWGDIADRLGVSQIEAQELARVAYARLGEAEADHLRTEVEDRIDSIVRKANIDLALCQSQGERTAIYRVLLAAEAQRSRLLGLNLRADDDHAA
ncbi:hypothetical protein [Microbacterium sp. PAMC21962]|uniref:hypothetical protein n=1 Tax=Microbacterium sp. PAMC21962 TaxID=2861280 RepID=UPI001C62D683|nr:hypothetical protein [Microbacterium sp. PAMC21962]QYF98276.1 hypothetical protein KY498_03250 [Microbacterium sp. PAMC21962]